MHSYHFIFFLSILTSLTSAHPASTPVSSPSRRDASPLLVEFLTWAEPDRQGTEFALLTTSGACAIASAWKMDFSKIRSAQGKIMQLDQNGISTEVPSTEQQWVKCELHTDNECNSYNGGVGEEQLLCVILSDPANDGGMDLQKECITTTYQGCDASMDLCSLAQIQSFRCSVQPT